MERMKMLQEEREDGDTSQEEMTTRFEKETKESLFVVSGDTFHSFPHSGAFFSPLSFGCSWNPDRPPSVFSMWICKNNCATCSFYFFLILCIIDGISDTTCFLCYVGASLNIFQIQLGGILQTYSILHKM